MCHLSEVTETLSLLSKMYFAFENQFIEPDDLLLARLDGKGFDVRSILFLKNTYKLTYSYCLNKSKYFPFTIMFEMWDRKHKASAFTSFHNLM